MKRAITTRRLMLASLLAGTTVISTGCSSGGLSLASMNPFSKPATPTETPVESSGITASLASAAKASGQQVSSVGETAKSAWSKTSSAVAGVFRGDTEEAEAPPVADPLSLSNRPKSIGPEVFVANGQLWESTGDFGKAMESYTKALETEPNNAEALTNIARLHFRQGNHQQAADYFQRALVQRPTDAGLHNDLGLTLNKLGNSAGACDSLRTALDLAPGTSRYANNLASVRFESGDAAGAYQVLAVNNKPAVAHFNMAYLYFKGGRVTAAQEHLAQAMQFEPQAATDPAIQRAVDRSRDLLAQINAATTLPIAQAKPEARLAAGDRYPESKSASQSIQPNSGIQPGAIQPTASQTTAYTTGSNLALPGTTSANSFPTTQTAPSAPLHSYQLSGFAPNAVTTGPGQAQATIPGSNPMTQATQATQTPTMPPQPSGASETPAIPFALPSGFGTN